MLYSKKLSNCISKSGIAIILMLLFSTNFTANAQQVTGLDGWSIFIDQGHSQTENMGLYGYSEPEKTLRIGLALREMLYEHTDIDTVWVSRETDSDQVSLSQRTTRANNLGADFYYSIHSNAGSNTTNNTLMLYGGWQEQGEVVEKFPPGGELMGDLLTEELTDAMRIPTIGNWADRTFYEGFVNHRNRYPYLHVNRETDMASVLSEGGFHTNPTQQQRNLNAEWKRLEAQAAFWSILRYHEAERPEVGIVTGFITDEESGQLLNGISVTIDGQTYTTDTYESLFNEYSNDPGELRNGFYYLEDLPNGTTEVTVEGPGYYSETFDVDIINDDFTFFDIQLTSSLHPYVASTYPTEGDTLLNPGDDIVINFSRPMNQESVENAFSTSEDFTGAELNWGSETELRITTDSLDFETDYAIFISSDAHDASEYEHSFDADGDGTPGEVFELNFRTGPEDFTAPQIVDVYPVNTRRSEVWPIVSVTFDEEVLEESIGESALVLKQSDYVVPGELVHNIVNEQSVLHFFPSEQLTPNRSYTISVSGDLSDIYGNEIGEAITSTFPTDDEAVDEQIVVDNFDSGVTGWWAPDQSGSSASFLPEYTSLVSETANVNLLTSSSAALRVNYGWDADASGHLIREYFPSSSPSFDGSYILQAYVFGDGNGNQFRFVVADSDDGYEASDWYTVDWFGWRLVSWDMTNDDINAWINGNGEITGSLSMDSFQLTYTSGQPNIGYFIADDLRAVKYGEATSNEELAGSELPKSISLDQNYPNPFNPTTNIRFGVPERSEVNLAVYDMLGRRVASLFNGYKSAGHHTLNFDASSLASGVYIYRLTVGNEVLSKKMLLMK